MQRLTSKFLGLIAVAAALLILGAAPTLAQITVSLPNATGATGTSGTIAVTVEDDLTGEGVLSYDFTVTFDENVVDITDIDADGTISDGITLNSTTTANSIRVVGASGSALEGSGTLINLVVDFLAEGTGNLAFTEFTFNEGDPVAVTEDGTTTVPAIAFTLPDTTVGGGGEISIPVTTQDLTGAGVLSYDFTVEFDPTVVTITDVDADGTISEDMTINSTTTANSIRVVAASGSALSGSGVVLNLTGTASGDEGETDLTFTSFTLNEGDPLGGGIDGSLTVTGNLAPVFTASLPDTTIAEGEMLMFDFDADDPEGSDVTFSITAGPGGATIDADTGVLTWTPTFDDAGEVTITVAASDGSTTATTSATVTVTDVTADFIANLSGLNEVPALLSSGYGTVNLTLDGDVLIVSGSFANLIADYAASHIHLAPAGTNGGVLIGLDPTVASDSRSGTYDEANNTFVLADKVDDPEAFRSALFDGDLYVNVHSTAHGAGEIRGQIRDVGNRAPNASEITEPGDGSSFTIEGDPTDVLVAIQASEASDPDGDEVNYILQASTETNFPLSLTANGDFDGPPGGVVTVDQAARIFDEASGAEPGSIPVGSSDELHLRVITTDGSRFTAGPTATVTFTRGLVTSNEDPSELPGEFALRGNYPNPFNPSTTVRFDLPTSAIVSVEVYDMLGRRVMDVPSKSIAAGADRSIDVDASTLTSGTYVYRVIAESTSDTMIKSGKMTLIK